MSHRVSITIDDTTFQALQAAAAARGLRPTTIAGELVTQAIIGPTPSPPGQLKIPTTPQQPPAAAAPAAPESAVADQAPAGAPAALVNDGRAGWLQLDRGPDWATLMWNAAQKLRASYPNLADALREGWHTDRFARDGTLALTIWRADLDTGAQPDPRLEHQWQAALRDFKRMLDDRQGHIGANIKTNLQPSDWGTTPPNRRPDR